MNAKQIIMRRAEIVADRVQTGWTLLSAHRPVWRASVDVYAIDLDDTSLCVLGQVFNEEWEVLEDAYALRHRAWLATDQSTDRPERQHFDNPYSYGLGQLVIASGVKVDIVEQRDDFARRHGFLAGTVSVNGSWDSITAEELNEAWSLALRGMEWGQR